MRHGVITEGAEPGNFRPYPYQLGILDAITDPRYEFITLKKSKRVGYTQIVTFALAYYIQQDPSSVLLVQPTIDDAKGYSKDTVAPMLELTPILQGLVSEVKSRDSKNTIEHKIYPGGSLHLRGANSMRGFRRLTKRVVIGDEVDAYPLLPGGDQIKAMIGRTETYGNRRKVVLGSTPMIEGVSRIDRAYQRSDQRAYMLPCPRCSQLQVLTWAHIKWPENDPARAYMRCEHCAAEIDHKQKRAMLEAALAYGDQGWHSRAEAPNHAGFALWAGYSLSPNAAWGQLAEEFLEVKGNPEELQTFTNEVLAETWQIEGEKLDHDEIYRKRRSPYEGVPAKACVLTAGVDVQKDRLEVEIVAWAEDEESWSIAYERLYGDPSKDELWNQLEAFLQTEHAHENGHQVTVAAACIDTGSNLYTENAYRYCKTHAARKRYAIKGQGGPGLPMVIRATRNNSAKVKLFTLGVDNIKSHVLGNLGKDQPGEPGYCNFPIDYTEDYFLGLAASEAVVRKRSRGQWYLGYVHNRRIANEPLDCRVYARAALRILNPAFHAFAKMLAPDDGAKKTEAPAPATLRRRRPPRRGNWVNSW